MKSGLGLAVFFTLSLIPVVNASAQGVTFQRVADTNTTAPSNAQLYTGFRAPVVHNGQATFIAFYSGGYGLYAGVNGSVARVSDSSTYLPGAMINISPSLTFHAYDSGLLIPVVYTLHQWQSGSSSKLFDCSTNDLGLGPRTITPSPSVYDAIDTGGGNFLAEVMDTTGKHAFIRTNLTTSTRIISEGDTMPGSAYTFQFMRRARIAGAQLVFLGDHYEDLHGVYLHDGTTVTRIVDSSMLVPGQPFTTFNNFTQVEIGSDGIYFYSPSEGLFRKSGSQILSVDPFADDGFAIEGSRILLTRNSGQTLRIIEDGVPRDLLHAGDLVGGVQLTDFEVRDGALNGNYFGFCASGYTVTDYDGVWIGNLGAVSRVSNWQCY